MTTEAAERTGRDLLVTTQWLAEQIEQHGDALPFVLIDAGEAGIKKLFAIQNEAIAAL